MNGFRMIREVKTFLAVVQHGTFARAGAHIGLTQSAVSAQIHRLEEELGFKLFDRTGRSAVLNEAGRQAVATASELLATYARLGQPARQTSGSGILRVGAIASAQEGLLPDALVQFRERLPEWRVRVVPGVSLNLLAQLDAEELDLAVLIKPPFALSSELRWVALFAEPFVLLATKRLRERPWRDLLVTEPFIRYDRGSFGGRLVDRFLRKSRITVNDVIELDELQGIVDLVERGVGIALVPRADSLRIPKSVVELGLDRPAFRREIGIARREQSSERPAAIEMVACLARSIRRS
jgi:DNA-binding transcriptional LysR family regulator